MSDFPTTRHAMLRAGYIRLGGGACKGCRQPIEWWKTTNGARMPFNPIASDDERAHLHRETCTNPLNYAKTQNAQPLDREVRTLRDRTNARLVVVIDEQRAVFAYDPKIPGEDLRHDLISAGNYIRNQIAKKEAKQA